MSTERGRRGASGLRGEEQCRGSSRFLQELADAIRPMAEPGDIYAEAARRLGEHLHASRAFCAEIDGSGEVFFEFEYRGEGVKPIAGYYRLADFGDAAVGTLRAGHVLAIADVEASDVFTDAGKQHCRAHGIRSLLKVPLAQEGKLLAFLALHRPEPSEWTGEEIALAVEAADRTWNAVGRCKAERALRLSEERYRTLFDTIDEGFCIAEVLYGTDGAVTEVRYREVNPAFARHTGLHDVVGKSSRELFPNLEPHWLQAVTRVMRTGRPERLENHLADLGRWLDVQYARVGGQGSRLLAVVFADVTERKRIEITSSRLAAIVEDSDDAIIRKSLDGIIETWNAGAQRIFGYAADEVIGKPVTVLIPPDRANEEAAILARLRRGETVDHYETVRRRKDGSLIDVALSISPIRDSDGNIVAASKIARDISQRKSAERVLRESERRHEFLLMLFDAMREQPDADAIAAVCVRMLARHMGVQRCYVMQLPARDGAARMIAEYRGEGLAPTHGTSGEGSRAPFPACMQRLDGGPLVIDDVGTGTELSDAEKSVLLALRGHAAFIAAPLRAGEQDCAWALVAASDGPRAWTREDVRLVEDVAHRAWTAIDRARKDAALREREAELRRVSRAKDEFIAMLGHELRNPLAPIATTLQLMKLRAPDVLARERSVIEAQVQHLTGLVNDLLDVARIATGKVELDSERVDVGDIVAAAVETTQPAMESGRQTLHVRIEEGLAVSGDRRRLVQVLVNLLGNAAKYSPPDRNVWLSAGAEDGQVVFRVRDEGQGIAPDLLPRIFESFIQDERAIDRSRGGLGLGLAIVRSLVLLHGGSVTAASDGAFKGSEFTVRLPLLDRPHPVAPVEQDALPAKAAATPERVRVLVVDDYAPAAENLALLLQEMGYRTAVANDGAAALQTMQTFNPQAALVDIGLPVIDGYEVAQTVRRTAGFEHLPLVAITGYGQASDRARALAAGFNEHMVKPLDAMRISELIERLVAENPVTALSGS